MSALPRVGDAFGRYRIDSLLGRGAMGVVYLATDPGIERRVALKVVAAELGGSADFLARFEREAAVLAQLSSAHVIAIYDYGAIAGCPYLATQYVPGGDLGALLDLRGPMPPKLAVRIVGQVAEALEDAHRAGIVHRDVKPTNVLLRDPDDPRMHAYLCDFGIARTTSTNLTAPGTVAGTWGYLSPECGRGAPATPSSDIYALGCLLWAALTGGPPYRGSDVEVAVAHQNRPVPQLPGGDPVAAAFNAVLRRSMAKRPEDRYPSAEAMRRELLAVTGASDVPLTPLPSSPVHERTTVAAARRAPTGAYTPASTRRRARWIAAACVAALAAGSGAAVALWPDDDPGTRPGGGEPTAAEPPRIRGDVDGDGLGDLVLAVPHTRITTGAESVLAEQHTWLSDGTTFTRQEPIELEDVDGLLTLMVLGDFDGDGTSEVLRYEVTDGELTARIYGTTSDGTEIDHDFEMIPEREYYPFVADLDGDGLDDVVHQAVTSVSGDYEAAGALRRRIDIQVSVSTGDGFEEISTAYSFPGITERLDLAFGDFDGDGDEDMVSDAYDPEAHTHTLTLYRSTEAVLEASTSSTQPGFNWFGLTGMDTDGDGDDEVVFIISGFDYTLGVVEFDEAEGEGWSTVRATGPLPRSKDYFIVNWAATDVDGDGDDDLAIAVPRPRHHRLQILLARAEGGEFQVERAARWEPENTETDYYGLSYAVGENLLP